MKTLHIISRVSVVAAIGATFTIWLAAGQEPNQLPGLLEAVAPLYPMVAVYSSTSGDVVVRVEVDRSGMVVASKTIDGHKLLQSVAESAAKHWRFEPGEGPRVARLIFSFRILPKEAAQQDTSVRFRPPYNIEVRTIVPEAMTNRDPGASVLKKRGQKE